MRRICKRSTNFQNSLEVLTCKYRRSSFHHKFIDSIIELAQSWQKPTPCKRSKSKPRKITCTTSFPSFPRHDRKEKKLQPSAMVAHKPPSTLTNLFFRYCAMAKPEDTFELNSSSSPCGKCALCSNHGEHLPMVPKQEYVPSPSGDIKLREHLKYNNSCIYVDTCTRCKERYVTGCKEQYVTRTIYNFSLWNQDRSRWNKRSIEPDNDNSAFTI